MNRINRYNPGSYLTDQHLRVGFSWGGLLNKVIPENHLHTQYISPAQIPAPGSDEHWMTEALNTSLSSIGITRPNPAVGCVLIDQNGLELARGATQAFKGEHAEAVAFNHLSDLKTLKGGTAYITLEPCAHQGHQPPCVDLLEKSSLKKIVISRLDPNPKTHGLSVARLQAAGKQVIVGTLGAETTAWNFGFIAQMVLQNRGVSRPVFGLKWAQTLDGQLVDDQGHSKWITSPLARSYGHWLRQKYDAVLIGANTLLRDQPSLDARDCKYPHQADPLIIVWDPKGLCFGLDQKHQELLLNATFNSKREVIIFTSESAFRDESWLSGRQNIVLFQTPGHHWIKEIGAILVEQTPALLGRPIQSVLVEGGPRTHEAFLKADYADVVHAFIAPKLTGGIEGRIGLNLALEHASPFELCALAQLGPDILAEMISPRFSHIWRD